MGAITPLKRWLSGFSGWAAGDFLAVAFGGTGATTPAGARQNLGAAASGANTDITSVSSLGVGTTTPYSPLTVVGPSRPYGDAASGGAIVQFTDGGGQLADGIRFNVYSGSYSSVQAVQPGAAYRLLLLNPNGGGLALGKPSPTPTATDGLPYIPVLTGAPTATPPSVTGMAPIGATSDGKLWLFLGSAWRSYAPQ